MVKETGKKLQRLCKGPLATMCRHPWCRLVKSLLRAWASCQADNIVRFFGNCGTSIGYGCSNCGFWVTIILLLAKKPTHNGLPSLPRLSSPLLPFRSFASFPIPSPSPPPSPSSSSSPACLCACLPACQPACALVSACLRVNHAGDLLVFVNMALLHFRGENTEFVRYTLTVTRTDWQGFCWAGLICDKK